MIILRMTLPIKFTLIMQRDCRGILKKLDTERNTLNFNHSDSQHIEYKHFFSNYLLTNRSFVFSRNYLEKFSELICIGWIEREFLKIIQIWKLKRFLWVVVDNCFMWWYEINCSEILWVHTIYLHVSCKYAFITKTFSSWPETWDTPKYLDIWLIYQCRRCTEKSKSYLIALRFLLCLFVSVGWNLLDFYTLILNEPDIDRIVRVSLNLLQLHHKIN